MLIAKCNFGESETNSYRYQIFSTTSKIMLPNWIRSTYSSIPRSYFIRRKNLASLGVSSGTDRKKIYIFGIAEAVHFTL